MSSWTFLHVTDIHIGSPRSFRFRPAYNDNWATAKKQILACEPELILVGGDQTRDGMDHRYELEAAKAELDSLQVPYHVIPGNMDIGSKWTEVSGRRGRNQMGDAEFRIRPESLREYLEVFGPSEWSFVHKDVRFSAADTILAGSGFPDEQAMWNWMEAQKEAPRSKRHVWMFHYPLFVDRPDEPNWDITDPDQYHCWYFSTDNPHRKRILDVCKGTGCDMILTGHIHNQVLREFEGIRFYYGASTNGLGQFGDHWPDSNIHPGFYKFTVTGDRIVGETIGLENVSTRKGYGQGGHIKPEFRDYSLAWEKGPRE